MSALTGEKMLQGTITIKQLISTSSIQNISPFGPKKRQQMANLKQIIDN
jgi:hypothetical protein